MTRILLGPWRLLRTTWNQMYESDMQLLASSLAFGTALSLVPLLAVSLSVFSALDGWDTLLNKVEPFIFRNLLDASGAQFSQSIRKSIHRAHSGAIGFGGAIGLFLASTKLFHDMETAVQRVWQIRARRSIIMRLVVYWLVMFIGPLVLAGALGVLSSKGLGLKGMFSKDTIAMGFIFVALLSIYKLVPACPVRWRSALISAAVATYSMALAKTSYAHLTKNILRYNKLYGSLASIPIFLLWIFVLWWICLAGVALCAAMERDVTPRIEE